ncbi:MAG: hypothetical protein ACRC3J_09640 [Culicoidibacterales bacterium]
MTIEAEVQQIMEQFRRNGFEIYIVGGYVRDYLLQQRNHDIDLATNARPEEIEALFPKTLSLGKAFGTITIVGEQQSYEVTTFRQDVGSVNHRKPEMVAYATTLAVDVARRDLTINGLAMDQAGVIIDYVGGRNDLAQKLIRTIGQPQQRFKEDAVRILRALRFAARLDFRIEAETFAAIKTCAPYLQAIAKERLRKEWNGIISSQAYQPKLIPEAVAQICFGEQWRQIIQFPSQLINQTQFWALVHLVTGLDWKYQKKEQTLSNLVRQRSQSAVSIRYLGLTLSEALELEQVSQAWQNQPFFPQMIVQQYERQIIRDLRELAITGIDCQVCGIEKRQIKAYLLSCAQAVNEHQIENTKQACLAYIEEANYGKENSININ